MRLVGVGDNTVDQYLHLGKMFPGGNAVNVAALASRSGHDASYIGWLGRDPRGQLILDALQSEGVDTSHCRVVDGPNAFCEIDLVNGERIFGRSDSGVCTQIHLTGEDLDFIAGHDLVHSSIYSGLENQLPQLASSSRRLSFDYSNDSTIETLTKTLPYVTIAAVSHPDLPAHEMEAYLRWAQQQGPELVLVTQGSKGAHACDGNSVVFQPVVEVEVIDTLGAGDAFLTQLLVSYYSGSKLKEAMHLAAHAAAETCGTYGAFGHGIPIQ